MSIQIAVSAKANAELDQLGHEIAELSAHLEAATARLLDLIREFDARGGWNNGFRSCAHWLSWRVGIALGAARERVRVAHALESLPRLAAALAHGELSYAKVRALTRVATPETEERLLAVGRAGTACHVERIVRGWRRVDRIAEAREAAARQKSRAIHVYQDEDGMVVVRGRLTPEAGAVLRQALDAARETLYQQAHGTEDVPVETPSMAQQQADALALLAETALHQGLDPGTPGERYQVVVHVDAPVLANPAAPGQSVLDGGTHVSAETSRRLACDATRVIMRHDDDGRVVEVGARTGSRAAACASARAITSATGPTGAPPHSRTSRCCVAAITAPSTKRDIRLSDYATASCDSADRTADCCRTSRLRRGSPTILFRRSGRRTRRRVCGWTRGRRVPAGWGSGSTWAGPSTSCIRGRSDLWRLTDSVPGGGRRTNQRGQPGLLACPTPVSAAAGGRRLHAEVMGLAPLPSRAPGLPLVTPSTPS